MTSLLDKIGEFKPEAVAPVLKGDWKLVFVDSAEAIHQVGSGLGKLPGSSIEDLFASIDAKGTVKIQEVVRVVGDAHQAREEEKEWVEIERERQAMMEAFDKQGLVVGAKRRAPRR